MSKKPSNLEKRVQKQLKHAQDQKRKSRLPWIFGSIVVVLALIVAATFLSDNFDNTQVATTNLYSKEVTLQQLATKVSAKDDFYAYYYQPSCEHCKIVSPFLVPLADKMGKPMFPVNIEGQHDAWTQYAIKGTPTLIHFKDGKEVSRIDGQRDPSVYSEFFASAQ
ncbi:thioredoxin family protein [Tumebacillus sp. ITR2]|uniref:Thioredoxin family protein n=1 Tax=Tumebacillus amylolyticus TaxID=2801339 RepID=A0ABS1J8H6_9BACL|nr:thioredoxin family protein [Tumebacillus amylolyticus]MBL0386495.1 thioredoxin family protein [Tumebacillus amylolyticus]